jgi:Na+/H+-dicarboxylate symporter
MAVTSKADVSRIYWKYLTLFVVAGAVLGVILGLVFKEGNATDATFVDIVKTPGDLFTRGLKCILVPYIFCAMITSVFDLRSIVDGSRIGWATCAYYVSTTLAAALLACLVSLLIILPNVETYDDLVLPKDVNAGATSKIDAYAHFKQNCGQESEVWCKIRGTLGNMVPSSIVGAMAESQLLGVMTFAVAVGLLIPRRQDGTSRIVELAEEVQAVMTELMFVVIAVTPIAVCSLLCWIVLKHDVSHLAVYIGWLLAASIVSQAIQALVVYPLLYVFLTRRNPIVYAWNIVPALTAAFATSSSAATLPWTRQCAIENNQVSKTIADFALPLGVTINMDGTCMTLIVSVFWLASAQGVVLDFSRVALMVISATVLSIGTSPIPSASLMYTGTIAEIAGVPLGSLFGVIVAVDWLRDRVRTCVNVMGDSFGVGILAHLYKIDDKDIEATATEETAQAPCAREVGAADTVQL